MVPRGAPCWDPEQVRTVMNVDGEALLDAVFAAVDTPYELWQETGTEGQRSSLTRDQFLEQFLSSSLPNARAVIQGQAGSGKSHIIKWLDVTLKGHPAARDAHVISIPRAGVSLRGILDAIIGALPDHEQYDYRKKLDTAGYRFADDIERRQNFISFLGLAIAADRVRSPDAAHAQIERALIGRDGATMNDFSLSNLFEDPYLRRLWVTTSTGPVARLVEHVVEARRQAIPRDERIGFEERDLPLTGQDLAQLAAPSRRVIMALSGRPAWKPIAIDLINRNIRTAIARMLNFSGDDLIQLLASVRRSLARQGKSLILLIEDLARLEGIDNALLEALIEPSRPGDAPLCDLRWAMAVTSGYLANTALMVRQRVNFIIDMDLRTSGQLAAVTSGQVLDFAGRYLNATRLGVPTLMAWHASNQGTAERAPVPNACTQGPDGPCQYRAECHAAFGTAGEQGLYPFNGTAIQSMLRIFDESAQGQFNPRRLLKDVLAEVLTGYHHELATGTFPDKRLRDQFVAPAHRLIPVVADRVQRANPTHAARQIPILELWGGSNQIAEVPPGIYESFGVPPVRLDGHSPTPPPTPPPSGQRDPLTQLIEAVQVWGNGETLAQSHLNGLRQRLFAAVCDRIDWNTLGISRSQVVGGAGLPFRPGFINFQGQATAPTSGTVTLTIPAEDEPQARSRAALAIGGLLLFERHGHWDSSDGYTLLVALAEHLDAWAASVVEQIRALPDGHGSWNPAPAAVELLAVGAVLGSRDGLHGKPLSALTDAIFRDAAWPEEPGVGDGWREIYRQIRKERTQLIQVVRTWAGGDKGATQSAFLDPLLVADVAERLRSGWSLTPVPADIQPTDDRYEALVRLTGEVASRVSAAARTTHQGARAWYATVEPHLDPGVSRDDLVATLRAVRNKATEVGGIFTASSDRDAVDRALDVLATLDLDAAVTAVTEASAMTPLASWPLLAPSSVQQTIRTSGPIVRALDHFLDSVQNAAQREINEAERSGDLATIRAHINTTLQRIDGLLTAVAGTPSGTHAHGEETDA